MTTLDGTILNVALPTLQRSFRASQSSLQWTVDGYTLLRASSLFICGSIADRFGRKRSFVVGLIMFITGSLACGLAPNLGFLIGFRCFQGFGSAVLTPSSLAIITNTFTEPRRRAWAIGMWNASTGVSTTAGPVIGGFLVQLFGWRSVFLVNIPIGLTALAYMKVIKESKSPTPRPFDFPGQIAIGLGLLALVYALISGTADGWHSPLVLSLFIASIFFWLLFVNIQRVSAHPLIPLRYLKRPVLSGAALLAILAFTVTSGFQFINTLYLQEVRGFSPLHAGLLAVPTTLAVLVVSPISGRLTGTRGARLPAVLAMLFMTAGMVLLACVIAVSSPLFLLIVAFLLLGIGSGLINTPITTAAISSMPKERAAVASAVATTGRQIGTTLGVALIGSIVFSVASGVARAKGAVASASLSSHAGALQFTDGMRYGEIVGAALACAGVVVALWAFHADSRRTDEEL
jgi:EmrB/QacA subfamily drug resistance transporter